ncbi:MAG TPA: hypothetical protein VK563_19285 [Puia sp.]|nr:hypothetical protein [Puia sp.]
MSAPDRIADLLASTQTRVTGIDFIYVYPNQQDLDVYFLRKVDTLDSPMPGTLSADDILIYSTGGELPKIAVSPTLNWTTLNGQSVLQLHAMQAGDFALYKFKIEDARLDPYYNDISFSFKANCPSDLDCKPPAHECPPDDLPDFPIDYLARDFWSYRAALLDFASLRYPGWADRLEADAGVMMAELMSAVGDEMSYYQDRVSREAYLETATQRRSIRRHARLVDYDMHDGLGATTWLDFTVKAGNAGVINPAVPAGSDVAAIGDNGVQTDFAAGRGLAGAIKGIGYGVDVDRNEFAPHIWDKEQVCLLVGTTSFYLEKHVAADLPFDDSVPGKPDGKWVLLQTRPTDPAQEPRAQLVRLVEVTDGTDPVLGVDITFIRWEDDQALQFEFDMTILVVRGNMVPATAGNTLTSYFITGQSPSDLSALQQTAFQPFPVSRTIEREGHDNTLVHLYSLPGSQDLPLIYLGDDPHTAQPEIIVREMVFVGAAWTPNGVFWIPQRSLLGVNSSEPDDTHFTLDDGAWQRVIGYQRIGEEFIHQDYATGNGVSIRFGDGEFGKVPDTGTVFRVDYRLGGGLTSNVAAGSLTRLLSPLSFIDAVVNPLPASGGLDPETPSELRQLAPQAFRAVTYRAVRPEDYAEAAERLPWVQKAGAAFRWTGSWLTAFVTADPNGQFHLDNVERGDLGNQMDRFRQAGREVDILDPEYANMDLDICICVSSDAYGGEVKGRVLEALLGKKGVRPVEGYFSPDRFTFGTFLERSGLEAALQAVPGVKAVEKILFRRRGWFGWKEFQELTYDPGKNVIISIENNPLEPQRGTVKIHTHGGL